MFKNRIRTAALAGAIAVATGVSGMAVPAFAQTQQGGVTIEDGSAITQVTPENVTEDQLRTISDETAAYLATFQEGGDFRDIVEDYITLGEDGFDNSEEAARIAFDEARQNATAELATASQNYQQARNSVAFALEADQQAEADWNTFVNTLQAAATALNPLIDDVNEANTHVPTFEIIDALPADVTTENAVPTYRALQALKVLVDSQYELAGDWNIDEGDGQYVNRVHIQALEDLKNAVDPRLETATEAYDVARASNIEAQKSDVLVRQLYLERIAAQRDTLRGVEALFGVVARYVELYQNNEIVGDTTLRTLYREVLENIQSGILFNVEQLNAADEATEEYHLAWDSDLLNNDDEDQYWEDKLDFAVTTYQNIFANGAIWQEQLERVELLDSGIIADREQEQADREAAEEAAEAAAQREQELLDLIEQLINDRENPGNGDDNDNPGNGGSSENAGLIGIIAAIGGVIALIAAAFPFIQNFMR